MTMDANRFFSREHAEQFAAEHDQIIKVTATLKYDPPRKTIQGFEVQETAESWWELHPQPVKKEQSS